MPAVRVLRIAPGPSTRVRILQRTRGTVNGLSTHWTREGSRLCREGCPTSLHALGTIWRGYLSVQMWLPDENLWRAAVLEVTEALEQSMRGEVDRGQVWALARRSSRKKTSREPVQGTILEHTDAAGWMEPFDVRPVLATVYHVMPTEIVLDKPSPMPDRLQIPDEAGPAIEVPDQAPLPANFSMQETMRKLGQKG